MSTTTDLTDDDLARLLGAAAASFEVPDDPPVRRELQRLADDHVPLRRRPGATWAVVASFVVLLALFGVTAAIKASDTADADTAASPAQADVEIPAGGASSAGSSADSGALDSGASSTGSTGTTGSTGSTGGLSPELPPVAAPDTATGFTASGSATTGSSSASTPSTTRSGTGTAAGTGSTGTSLASAPAPSQGKVVKTGAISLLVDDGKVTSTLNAVQRVAAAQGAIVFASTTDEAGDSPSGQITLRVPVSRFEATVLGVRGLDAEVASATTKAADVTAQYADLQTQIRTLKATRERYLVILGRTDTIGEVLSVQQRVDSVSGQIDQLQGRLNVLSSQSDLSTLTVGVTEKSAPTTEPTTTERTGLSKAWHDARHGFSSGINGIISRSGRTLVVLLSLAVLGLLALGGYRLVRRRML